MQARHGHLVLSRFKGEAIMIDGDTLVTIEGVNRNGKVQLSVSAPVHKTVDRYEIHKIKLQEAAMLAKERRANTDGTC